MRTIQLQLEEGHAVPVLVRKQTTERSPHTGRDLVELHVWCTTADEAEHQGLATTLRELDQRTVRAIDERGEFAGRWCVSWNSYGESAGVHTYTLLLREAEELRLEALLLNGLELHPYEYREAVVGDGLTVEARVETTSDDLDRVRALVRTGDALRVVRAGIQDEPREMRVGVAQWAEAEDLLKLRLVLLDRSLDALARPEIARIEEENSRAALGYYADFLERLADLMVRRGVLSAAELEALRDDAQRAPGIARREVWRVAEV